MRLFAIMAVFAVALLLFGCAQQEVAPPVGGQQNATPAPAAEQAKDKTPIELLIEAQKQRAEAISKRPDYLPEVVYQNLPAFPKDFYEMRVLVQYGKLDLQDIGEEYWKQPEWYPSFEGAGLNMMQNPPRDRWGAWGIGVYPSDMMVETDQGTSFTATTYIYSSWLVQTYQGVGAELLYPASSSVSYEQVGFKVVQDPVEAAKQFEVSFEPKGMLIGPSFPIFGEDWAQKQLVHVQVKPDAKPGNYVIGVNPGPPPSDMEKEWFKIYRTKYVTSAFSSGLDRPYFQITVVVKEKGAA
ncbi:MAG: hypothetical protein Q7T16_06325 [Candidatus Burarchaeum sp.]|nr:hypothetical protein [Candidatus Burarchaeum sp.]MDO8340244.1 hypothetical protein [Candidatus Burarchaeum sp.]